MVVSTKDIQTSSRDVICDVCGRTLLRGERAEVYIAGATHRLVCGLCTSQALHEGWVREGPIPAFEESAAGSDRPRSLLARWWNPRENAHRDAIAPEAEEVGDAQAAPEVPRRRGEPAREPRSSVREGTVPAFEESAAGSDRPRSLLARWWNPRENAHRDAIAPAAEDVGDAQAAPEVPRRRGEPARDPRHVRAVPTSTEQKVASAIDLFNGSEQHKTVAAVARSLGVPTVSVRASGERASVVTVVVSWELCWYRYDVDLSDDQPSVRVAAKGYELDELPPEDREPNAVADDHGALSLVG